MVLEEIAMSTEDILREITWDLHEIRQDIREFRRDQKNNLRLKLGVLMIIAVGLAGLMARGFQWF